MFINIILLVAICGIVINASNLRSETDVAMHPNPSLGEQILKQIRDRRVKSGRVVRDLNIQQHDEKKSLSVSTMESSSPGYFITRQRANADCSGFSEAEMGYRTNTCFTNKFNNGFSFDCVKDGDRVLSSKHTYNNDATCSGTATLSNYVHEQNSQCEFDENETAYSGLVMRGQQCDTSDTAYSSLRPGLVTTYHTDSSCQDTNLIAYETDAFGVCQLYVDYSSTVDGNGVDEDTRFWYMKLDSCTKSGKVLVHLYTDPACTRKQYFTHINLNTDTDFSDAYNSCEYDGSISYAYRKVQCKREN